MLGTVSKTELSLTDEIVGFYTLVAKATEQETSRMGVFRSFDWAPDGTARFDPMSDELEIPGTIYFAGASCNLPYTFTETNEVTACLS